MAKNKKSRFSNDQLESKMKRQSILDATGGDRRFVARSIPDKKKQANKDGARVRSFDMT